MIKGSYQTFPWQPGSSLSIAKLSALHLPDLAGKRVLDVGCNTGFFCGFAAWQGASEVVGIDKDRDAINTAKQLFPACKFMRGDWRDLGPQKYDVILFISAIHYARDQAGFLASLMQKLNPNGLLILEIGVAPGEDKKFVQIERSIDSRFFPTWKKLEAMLEPFAVKQIGPSVLQRGDPLPRHIFHLRNKLPEAVLFMDAPYSGKSTIARSIINSDLKRISGDLLYYEIMSGKKAAPTEIRSIIENAQKDGRLNCRAVTCSICKSGHARLLCDLLAAEAGGQPFLLDMSVPEAYHNSICSYFEEKNYFVVNVSLFRAKSHPAENTENEPDACKQYLDYLNHNFLIDEKAYLEANPGVAKAVADGTMPSAQFHWWNFGRFEGRRLGPDNEKIK